MPSLFDIHKSAGQGKTTVDPSANMIQQIRTVSDTASTTNTSESATITFNTSTVGAENTPKKADFSNYALIPFTDQRLLTKPDAFDFEKPNYLDYAETPLAFAEALFEKMLSLNGVGLSANQLGIPLRVFVFGNQTTRNYVFNPEVVGVSKEMALIEERCLSFPGFSLTLNRPEKCGVTFQTEEGGWFVSTLDGIAARVFLHEYDHMEGITFLHWASKFKVEWELGKVTKRLNKLGRNKKMRLQPKENNGKTK